MNAVDVAGHSAPISVSLSTPSCTKGPVKLKTVHTHLQLHLEGRDEAGAIFSLRGSLLTSAITQAALWFAMT